MADKGQRTEQPTQRRLEKARRQGQFPVSRELAAGVEFAVFVAIMIGYSGAWLESSRRLMRHMLAQSFHTELTAAESMRLFAEVRDGVFLPLLIAIAACKAASAMAHLAVTRFAFSAARLTPNWNRINPLAKLTNLPKENVPQMLQAAILIPLVGVVLYGLIGDHLPMLMTLPKAGLTSGLAAVGEAMEGMLWKAAGLFTVLGLVDLYRRKRQFQSSVRMTKQEVREEMKEVEGNPQVKLRIRRMRRDLLRRRMMSEVPKATAVIVNPTHFSVAIRYDMDATGAPRVVAKGKNYLALLIRTRAIENQVPILENPPLAQALYQSVEVGQEIPAHLYRAVAEVLAYIYRLMNRRR